MVTDYSILYWPIPWFIEWFECKLYILVCLSDVLAPYSEIIRTNNIAVHNMQTEHSIDWENATCPAYRTNCFELVFLESWLTNAKKNTIDICRELPATYSRLVATERQNRCERNTTRTVTPTGGLRQVDAHANLSFNVPEDYFRVGSRNVGQIFLYFKV